ncbi:uncharacterized protein LJ206_015448 isoform 1-T1 [Theristicus caerulescens]
MKLSFSTPARKPHGESARNDNANENYFSLMDVVTFKNGVKKLTTCVAAGAVSEVSPAAPSKGSFGPVGEGRDPGAPPEFAKWMIRVEIIFVPTLMLKAIASDFFHGQSEPSTAAGTLSQESYGSGW